jgi:hypothetical protein
MNGISSPASRDPYYEDEQSACLGYPRAAGPPETLGDPEISYNDN